jgi:type II secretory pathway pseudopilin PulG
VVRKAKEFRGFTLIEAAMTTAIIGIAFVAVMELFAACTKQNRYANHTTTAMMLAEHVREMMIGLPFADPNPLSAVFGAETGESLETYDDLDDFNGLSFNPPVDAQRQAIPELSQYTQTVSVVAADPNQPSVGGTAGKALRVRVVVTYRPGSSSPVEQVYSLSWLVMNN